MTGGSNYYQLNPKGPIVWIPGGIQQIQLDIVGFLAILGEGSVLSNSQVEALSVVTFLPRLMPAPQALLRPSRPDKLDPHNGYTIAVHSGNFREHINHIGHMLVDSEKHLAYSVRVVKLERRQSKEEEAALEKQELNKKTGLLAPASDQIRQKRFGPLYFLSIYGFCQTIVLVSIAGWQKDGMSVMAIVLLSFLSTLVGVANKWTLQFPKRAKKGGWTPPGDVVIRYAKGSFLVVQCTEDVARELYFAPEDINYMVSRSWAYRSIALVGTVALMFGVIFLGNAQTYMQLGIAGAYLIMNVLYWLVAALPAKMHWDTSCFEIKEQCIAPVKDALPQKHGKKYIDRNETFTQALWKIIVVTKEIDWIRRSNTAPDHPAWDEWLKRAQQKAKEETCREEKAGDKKVVVWTLPEWDAQEALKECYAEFRERQKVEAKC